jgi:hypothetical protein
MDEGSGLLSGVAVREVFLQKRMTSWVFKIQYR